MSFIKKYVGDKDFYRMAVKVTLPIMIQNLITNFVSLLDNLMVGSLGTEQMSSVSIVNQLLFIFNLAIFGALSGAGIFTAQFYGKKDNEGIRYTLRYKLGITLLIFVVGVVIFTTLDDKLISLYLHESDGIGDIGITLGYAQSYLKVMLWGLLPFCIAQIFSSTLRETGETVMPMVAGFIAVVVNCCFNWVLIFGKLGAPALGVVGAAIATVISRYSECLFLIIYTICKKKRFPYLKGAFRSMYIPVKTFKLITIKGMPLLFNECFWSMGMSLLNMAYSLYGISVVAGTSISSTIMNLAGVAFIAFGGSIGIIIGKLLGADKFEEAVDADRKLIALSAFTSVVIGIFVFIIADKIPDFYNTTDEAKAFAAYFIKVCAIFIPVHSFANSSYFTIRSGGKTLITFLMDSVFIMFVSVPFAFAFNRIFNLPIETTFFLVQAIDIIKVIIGLTLVKKKVWLNNIVNTD